MIHHQANAGPLIQEQPAASPDKLSRPFYPAGILLYSSRRTVLSFKLKYHGKSLPELMDHLAEVDVH